MEVEVFAQKREKVNLSEGLEILNAMREIADLYTKIEAGGISADEIYNLNQQSIEAVKNYIYLINGCVKKPVWYLYESGNERDKGGKYYLCKDILDDKARTVTRKPDDFDYVIVPEFKYYDSNTSVTDLDRLIMYKDIRNEYFKCYANNIKTYVQTGKYLCEAFNEVFSSYIKMYSMHRKTHNFTYRMNNIK